MSILSPAVRAVNRARRYLATNLKTIVAAVLSGLGCVGSLALVFFGVAAVAFAAWMTALGSNQSTMSHDEALRQTQIGTVMVVVGCVVGVLLLAWILYRVLRRESRREPKRVPAPAQQGNGD
jgi:uncharacterized membrane protein YidH (DUF202 family)